MNKKIKKLENCIKAMKRCRKIPNVESCICFSDAFKVLKIEVDKLHGELDKSRDPAVKKKISFLKKEVSEITKIISKGDKECIGCNPCIASVVFKAYPDALNNLYINNGL